MKQKKFRLLPYHILSFLMVLSLSACSGASDEMSPDNADLSKEQSAEKKSEEEIIEDVKEIAWPKYEDAVEVAMDSPDFGRFFTDHKTAHAEMVEEKALEMADALKEAIEKGNMGKPASKEGRIALSSSIDYNALIGASLSHDTGMCGIGYTLVAKKDANGNTVKDADGGNVYEMESDGHYRLAPLDPKNFGSVRSSHSLNSALIVLIGRDDYKESGYSDEQIDKIAAECMAHSKSHSGVSDLNSKADWQICFDRLDSLVAAYNKDHPDQAIRFDRTVFEKDDALLASLASETLCLRVGDVSRDSGPAAEAQSGENIYVDRSTVDDHGGSVEAEIANAELTIGTDREPVFGEKDLQVHIGEQNIVENHTVLNEAGGLTHIITINDGCSGPKCTQQAIEDHLGEFYSARDEQFTMKLEFISFGAGDADFFRDSYDSFRKEMAERYPSITILCPWDNGEAVQTTGSAATTDAKNPEALLPEGIVPVTWEPSSDELIIRTPEAKELYDRIKSGDYPGVDELKDNPVVAQIDALSSYYTALYGKTSEIDTPERQKLRDDILEEFLAIGSAHTAGVDIKTRKPHYEYIGELKKDFQMELVLGLPASGKSSRVTDPDSEEMGAFILDCDVIKEMIPEYKESHGCAADAVHMESMMIMDAAVKAFTEGERKGTNVILPLVAGDFDDLMETYIKPFEKAGYNVKAKFMECEENASLSRNIARELETGRIINSAVIFSFGSGPKEVFDKLAPMTNSKGEKYGSEIFPADMDAEPIVLDDAA